MTKYKAPLLKEGKVFHITRNTEYELKKGEGVFSGLTLDEWKEKMREFVKWLSEQSGVMFVAAIFHDRDLYTKGDKKGQKQAVHLHILMRFENVQQQSLVRQVTQATSDENCQVVVKKSSMARYLLHISDYAIRDRKVIYNESELILYNCDYSEIITKEYWGEDGKEDELSAYRLVSPKKAQALADGIGEMIETGEVRKDKGIALYKAEAGSGWARKYRHTFKEDQQAFIDATVKKLISEGRNLTTIYLMGAGGSTKTSMAQGSLGKRFAGDDGLYPATIPGVGKTPDILGKYVDEKVLVINELSAQTLGLNEFNSTLDPKNYAAFSSRGEDKHFIGDYCFITNSISPLRFAKDTVVFDRGGKQYQDPAHPREIDKNNPDAVDKYWQVRRRLKHLIVLHRDEDEPTLVHCSIFNLRTGIKGEDGKLILDNGDHVYVGTVDYVSIPDRKPEITDAVLDDIEKMLAVDVSKQFDDVVTIEEYLEKYDMIEMAKDVLFSNFVDDVVKACKWDLLPTRFLYDLYKSYREEYYPSDEILSIQRFSGIMDVMLADGWVRKNDVHTLSKMDADEPLITEYGLDAKQRNGKFKEWRNQIFSGTNPQKIRDFERKNKYSGYVRK